MSLKKHYSEKARLLNDKAVEKIADTQGNYIANNWYGEWETGGAVWFDYSLETGKWMEAYSKLVDGDSVNVEIQTVPLTDDTDLNEIEQLINAGLAYYTDNPHLCISISPKALNPDPFTPIATKFDFINLFPLEPEDISIATPAKHALDTNNEPNTAKPANTGTTKPADDADKSNDANNNTADKPIDKPVNTGNKTDVTSSASKPTEDTDNATPKTTVKTANANDDTAKSTANDSPTNTSKPNATTGDNEPKTTVTDSDPNSAKPASNNEPIDTGKTTDKSANTGTDNDPVNNSSTSTAKPTDDGSKAEDTTPKTDNAVPKSTTTNTTPAPAKTTDNKPSTTDTDNTPKTTGSEPRANNTVPENTDSAKPIDTTPKSATTDTNSTNTADKATTTPAPKTTATDSDTSNPAKPSTTDTTPKTTDSDPKTTGDKTENSTTPTDTDSTKTADKSTTVKPADTEPKTNNVTPLDPPTITDVYQPVTPLYSQDGSLPTPPSNTIDQLLNVLMAQGVFSNDTVLSGTLQDFGVTTGGATQWANAGNQQIGSGYMGQLWFTPFGQQTITDLSNNGYIWTDTMGTDYSDDDDALITFNSVTTKQSPIAGVMESTEWVKGTTWEQIPKTEIPFKTLSADSLLCQMIQSGNVILWKKNVKPNGTDMIAALPTQTFTDYLGNKWTAPLAN